MTALWWGLFVFFFFGPLSSKMQKVLFFTPLDKLPQDKLNPVYSAVVLYNYFFLNLSFKLKHFNNIKNLSSFRSPFFQMVREKSNVTKAGSFTSNEV